MAVVVNPTISVTDSLTVSNTGGPYSMTSGTGISVPWNTTTVSSDTCTIDPNWHNNTSAKIQLNGPEADIEINGESLIDMLRNIEQRLNILKPNPDLESEWEELRALGNAYRKLEAEIKAKMKTWDAIAK
jgi:hypothetical protein